MNTEILKLVDEHAGEKSFSRVAPPGAVLDNCQAQLGIALPDQYRGFLELFGQGGFNGVQVLGISASGKPFFVLETLRLREHGLPENLVMIENCDEWAYCLDCESGTVVEWGLDGETRPAYPDFDSYFLDRLRDAAENL